jgi:nucleoside-diphosphate-sugar epimerase
MVAAAVKGEPVKIGIRPGQKANFIYVDDVAEQLVRMIRKEKLSFRMYNSGGITSTPADFAKIVKKYIPGADISFAENAPQWPYPPMVDGSRLEREIDLKVRQPEDGLLEQINQERAGRGMAQMGRIP